MKFLFLTLPFVVCFLSILFQTTVHVGTIEDERTIGKLMVIGLTNGTFSWFLSVLRAVTGTFTIEATNGQTVLDEVVFRTAIATHFRLAWIPHTDEFTG